MEGERRAEKGGHAGDGERWEVGGEELRCVMSEGWGGLGVMSFGDRRELSFESRRCSGMMLFDALVMDFHFGMRCCVVLRGTVLVERSRRDGTTRLCPEITERSKDAFEANSQHLVPA